MREHLEENERTIGRKWENNWKKIGEQLEENGRTIGSKWEDNC